MDSDAHIEIHYEPIQTCDTKVVCIITQIIATKTGENRELTHKTITPVCMNNRYCGEILNIYYIK